MSDRPGKQKRLLEQIKHFYPDLVPRVFEAIDTRHLKNHHVGCGLSHRGVIQEAKNKGYKKILVFEEDAIFHKDFSLHFDKNINELKKIEWDVCYLGAMTWNRNPFPKVAGCKNIEIPNRSTCTEGVAYNESLYDYILKSWPPTMTEMRNFCKRHAAIDQWLMSHVQGQGSERDGFGKKNAVIFSPRICSQPWRIRNVVEKPMHDKKKDFLT
jgi:GR25 family glycosyltransferase involved in LPS biosynthesis